MFISASRLQIQKGTNYKVPVAEDVKIYANVDLSYVSTGFIVFLLLLSVCKKDRN